MGKKSKSRTLVMIIVALVLINIFLMIGSYLVSKNSSQGKENTANPTKVENVGNLSSVTSLEGFVPGAPAFLFLRFRLPPEKA